MRSATSPPCGLPPSLASLTNSRFVSHRKTTQANNCAPFGSTSAKRSAMNATCLDMGKTQHSVHNNRKGSAEFGRVVVDAQHSLYSDARCTVESSFICHVPHVECKNLSKLWKNVLQSDLACARFQESESGENLLKSNLPRIVVKI